ncbi:MAG TPA: asparagine synthase-related protein, partial [Chitinophagaceae bacterium]|nr:asparagine synthase-related protein [Chitinophagaceae bacterium]
VNLSSKLDSIPSFARRPLAFGIDHSPGFIKEKIAGERNSSRENLKKYTSYIRGDIDLVDMIDYANQAAMPGYIDSFMTRKETSRGHFLLTDAVRNLPGRQDRLLAFDYLNYLPGDILTKVDRATMSISLEGREPLLDQNLIEWVATLPDEYKYHKGTTKSLLKKIVHRHIPREIMHRPKMGFSIPLVEWFRKDLKGFLEEHLSEKALAGHGLIDYSRLHRELEDYYKGNNFRFSLIWNILMFQLWYEKWMK